MADIPLEAPGGVLRYGSKGPDKWTFIHDGILDRKHDGTDHEFLIDGKKVRISISEGRPLPYWQCPSHPEIDPNYHPYEWVDAWEFSGVGDGCHIRGIYSPKSRKGVFHFWPIHVAEEGCPDAQRDMRLFFSADPNGQAMLALTRAMEHMVRGTEVGGYHVDCSTCWETFQKLRQFHQSP